MSDNPYMSPESAGGPVPPAVGEKLDYHTIAPLFAVAGWLRFLGILNIIFGAIYCLTIVGLIIGWLPLWIGITLNKASSSLQTGYTQRNYMDVRSSMESLALVIKIFGVLALIGLVINILYFGFILVVIFTAAAGGAMG